VFFEAIGGWAGGVRLAMAVLGTRFSQRTDGSEESGSAINIWFLLVQGVNNRFWSGFLPIPVTSLMFNCANDINYMS
jgi:hypothetical protein